MIRAAISAAFVLVAGAAAAEPTACPGHYAGAEAPKIIERTLAVRLKEVCRGAYGVVHSGLTRAPLWSAERLTTASVIAAEALPRIGSFFEDTSVEVADRAKLDDYRCSGFDRGHMAPAGNTGTADDSRETFSLANMVPQDPYLNQGLWAALEGAVRKEAKAGGEAFVVSGPLYFNPAPAKLKDRVLVPTHTFKAVYFPNRGASAYVARNWETKTYLVLSIAELTELSGIDVFPALPAEVKEKRIELPAPSSTNFGTPFVAPCHRAPRTDMGRPNP
jgi:endonuclease G